jgi:hypothetical protein
MSSSDGRRPGETWSDMILALGAARQQARRAAQETAAATDAVPVRWRLRSRQGDPQ